MNNLQPSSTKNTDSGSRALGSLKPLHSARKGEYQLFKEGGLYIKCLSVYILGDGEREERETRPCRYIEAVNYGNLTECRDCSAWG